MGIGYRKKSNKNIYRLFAYVGFSNLFFERCVFVIFLAYKGFGIAEIALWQSIVNFSMMIGEIPTGLIADKIGKKKSLIIGNLLIITYYFSMLLSGSFIEYAMGAVMFGIGSTFMSGTDDAFLYDLLDTESAKKNSVKYLGGLSAVITFSIGCAMLLGGFMQKINWNFVMISGIVVQTISIIIMVFLPNIIHPSEKPQNIVSNLKSFLKLIKGDTFIRSIIILLGINVGVVSAVYILAQDFFSKYGLATEQISIIFVVETALSVIVFSQIHKIQKWFGNMKSLLFTLTGTLVAFVLLNISNKFVIVIMVLMISIFNNYFSTILMDVYDSSVPANIRATAISCFNMISSLIMSGIFLAVSAFEQHYIFFLCILGVVATFPLYYLIIKFKEKINAKTSTPSS